MFETSDFAYAAGYIDGDGCFYVGKTTSENREKFRCSLIINTTEIENVQFFQRLFGGDILSTKKSKEIYKPLYRYVLRGKNLDQLASVEPYLVEKQEEFALLNKFRASSDKSERDSLMDSMKVLKFERNIIKTSIKEELESIRFSILPTKEDFAYLAGFIDSECCLNIQKSFPKGRPNPTYKIQLQCGNTKSPCFYWISKRFGGQFHFIDKSHLPNHRNVMSWRLSAAALFPILENVYPFLIHKKPVCKELIEFYKTTLHKGHISPNSPGFKDFYKPILDLRESIFHKIQILNKKGINLSG